MRGILIIAIISVLLGSCVSTPISSNVDPCQMDIRHPDILRCLQRKAVENYNSKTYPDFEKSLCDCKKEFYRTTMFGE